MVSRRELLKGGAIGVSAFTAGCSSPWSDSSGRGGPPGSTTGPHGGTPTTDESAVRLGSPTGHSASTTVAFIADQGLSDSAREVLRLIVSEDADLIVHSGDFDYHQDPEAWRDMLDDELGPDFPYVASIGNHDIYEWDGYREVLKERIDNAVGLEYTGDIGLQATYTYGQTTVVAISSQVCSGDDFDKYPTPCRAISEYDHEAYVATQLSTADTTWRIGSWHMPNHMYQVGEKAGVHLSTYDACRKNGGAIIATGHNHAYARTYPMSSFADASVASTSPPYTVGDGATIDVVSAISGESFYPTTGMVDADYWASTYTRDDEDHAFGAFFGTFRDDGTGECYFKNVDGEIVDGPFAIQSALAPATSETGPAKKPRRAVE